MGLHFQGFGNELNLCELLSDNYAVGFSFCYEEETTDTIPNVSLRIYESNKKCTLKEAENGLVDSINGTLEATGQDYGYSEYTIEGFTVSSAIIGGHDIQKIIDSKKDKYLHIVIEKIKKSNP